MSCACAFPSLAAEYKEEKAGIIQEPKDIESELKPIREENRAVAAKYKAIRTEKKESGELSIDKADWKEVREQAKAKDFDGALGSLEQALELKKSRLEDAEEINSLWDQIDALIGWGR